MVRFLFVMVVAIFLVEASHSETWITIEGKARRIKKSTNCKKFAGDDPDTACDCCIIRNTSRRHESLEKAIKHCAKQFNCPFDRTVFRSQVGREAELKKAKRALKPMSIIDVHRLSDLPEIPQDGTLTTKTVGQILKGLVGDGHLDLPKSLFESKSGELDRLKISALGGNAGGVFTGQLFSIQYDAYFVDKNVSDMGQDFRPLYILKETTKGVSEIEHLYRMNISDLIEEKTPTLKKIAGLKEKKADGMARIAFDDLHFKLKTDGKFRYFSLLQTAPGKSLHQLLESFGKTATFVDRSDKEYQDALLDMKHAFFRIGFALSALHQKYAEPTEEHKLLSTTYTHGDLHSQNIFYDQKTGIVTLIDNETFALSFKRPLPGISDIVDLYMLHTMRTVAHTVARQLTLNKEFGIDDKLWHELWQELFVGYLSAFGELKKEDYQTFRQLFFNGFKQKKLFRSMWDLKDQRKLKRLGPSFRRSHIISHDLKEAFEHVGA